MIRVLIEDLEQSLELVNNFTTIKLENSYIYRKILLDFPSTLIISENNKELKENQILVVTDLLNIDINNKKILTLLYKLLENNLEEKDKELISQIEKASFELFENINDDVMFTLNYDNEISFEKICSLFHLSINSDDKISNYLNYFLNYIKTLHLLTPIKLIITNGLFSILTKQQQEYLEYELKLYNIFILDIVLGFNSQDLDKIEFIVDDKFCII